MNLSQLQAKIEELKTPVTLPDKGEVDGKSAISRDPMFIKVEERM